jgi:hypothetical protein
MGPGHRHGFPVALSKPFLSAKVLYQVGRLTSLRSLGIIRGKSQSDIGRFGSRGAGSHKPVVLASGDKKRCRFIRSYAVFPQRCVVAGEQFITIIVASGAGAGYKSAPLGPLRGRAGKRKSLANR